MHELGKTDKIFNPREKKQGKVEARARQLVSAKRPRKRTVKPQSNGNDNLTMSSDNYRL